MSYPLRSCHRCGKGFFSSYKEHICQDCLNDLGWEPTPYTNADHIRYMTDEELAVFLHTSFSCYGCPARIVCESADLDCDDIVFDWIKQPYKEDT